MSIDNQKEDIRYQEAIQATEQLESPTVGFARPSDYKGAVGTTLAGSSQLKRLKVECGFYDLYGGWTGALKKFPLLEELNLYATKISAAAVEIAGRNCPMLRILKLNQDDDTFYARESDAGCLKISDEIAIAIGKNFHGLRHLELIRSRMLNIGLLEILNGCIQLETLDLRRCMNIDLNGNLGKRCFEQIKCLKLPNDSLETREVFVYVPVNGKYILQKTTREI